jgi:hypothetical protein
MDPKRLIPKRKLDISGKDEKEFGLAVSVILGEDERPVVYLINKEYEENAENILKRKDSSAHDAASVGHFLGDEIPSDSFFELVESDMQGLKSTQENCFAFYRVKLRSSLRKNQITEEANVRVRKKTKGTKSNFGERPDPYDFSSKNRIDEISAKPSETKTLLHESARSSVSRYVNSRELLKTPLSEVNAVEIYSQAQAYCDNQCTEPSNLNPMITCQDCKIMEIKGKALRYINKSSQE